MLDGQQTAEKSPNFHIGIDRSTPRMQLAEAVVRALREVYKTHHPGELQYQAFQGDEAYAIRSTTTCKESGKLFTCRQNV